MMSKLILSLLVIAITVNCVISGAAEDFMAKLCSGDQEVFKMFSASLKCSMEADTKDQRAIREKCFVDSTKITPMPMMPEDVKKMLCDKANAPKIEAVSFNLLFYLSTISVSQISLKHVSKRRSTRRSCQRLTNRERRLRWVATESSNFFSVITPFFSSQECLKKVMAKAWFTNSSGLVTWISVINKHRIEVDYIYGCPNVDNSN